MKPLYDLSIRGDLPDELPLKDIALLIVATFDNPDGKGLIKELKAAEVKIHGLISRGFLTAKIEGARQIEGLALAGIPNHTIIMYTIQRQDIATVAKHFPEAEEGFRAWVYGAKESVASAATPTTQSTEGIDYGDWVTAPGALKNLSGRISNIRVVLHSPKNYGLDEAEIRCSDPRKKRGYLYSLSRLEAMAKRDGKWIGGNEEKPVGETPLPIWYEAKPKVANHRKS